MPLKNILDTYNDLHDHLEQQLAEVNKWKAIATFANADIPNSEDTFARFESAQEAYDKKVWANLENEDTTHGQEAFVQALIAIELAPPEVQKEALAKLVSEMDALEFDDDYDFYTELFAALGKRLHPSNQATALEWLVVNVMTARGKDGIDFCIGDYDPNNYSNSLCDTAKAEVGNTLLEEAEKNTDLPPYSDQFLSWITSLLPKDHPRLITRFTRSTSSPLKSFDEIWLLPKPNGQESILVVNTEVNDLAIGMNDITAIFKDAANSTLSPMEDRLFASDCADGLAQIFDRYAADSSRTPAQVKALLDAAELLRTVREPS